MKRILILLFVLVFLNLGASALAEGGVYVEVIRADGVSVVQLTVAGYAQGAALKKDIILPEALTLIGEGAFEGISAKSVEVTENVVAIEARAFADCKNLRQITIPATVLEIDDSAFDGCNIVTVYGTRGTEAERIAVLYGFPFIDPNDEPVLPPHPSGIEENPVELPPVSR